MQNIKLSASVGENAKNNKTDVILIQKSLNKIIAHNILIPLAPLEEDGIAGAKPRLPLDNSNGYRWAWLHPMGELIHQDKQLKK
ncbi:MAG: hypothetical protein RL497_2870 [Pseudomonadota bacterium]|jgi:hypothetical protein